MTSMCLIVNTASSCCGQGERGAPGLNGTQGHQGCAGRRGLKVQHPTNTIISLHRLCWVYMRLHQAVNKSLIQLHHKLAYVNSYKFPQK